MKALLIVDVQNDFFDGGALGITGSNKIIPIVNKLQNKFEKIFFTQDWHPQNHCCFATNNKGTNVYDIIDIDGCPQIMWPVHCVENTKGSEFHKDIVVPQNPIIIKKGTNPSIDSYSGFFDNHRKHLTDLKNILDKNNILDLYICGLATDFCVKFTALDAMMFNYNTFVIADATAAVNQNPHDYQKALEEMKEKKVKVIYSNQL